MSSFQNEQVEGVWLCAAEVCQPWLLWVLFSLAIVLVTTDQDLVAKHQETSTPKCIKTRVLNKGQSHFVGIMYHWIVCNVWDIYSKGQAPSSNRQSSLRNRCAIVRGTGRSSQMVVYYVWWGAVSDMVHSWVPMASRGMSTFQTDSATGQPWLWMPAV